MKEQESLDRLVYWTKKYFACGNIEVGDDFEEKNILQHLIDNSNKDKKSLILVHKENSDILEVNYASVCNKGAEISSKVELFMCDPITKSYRDCLHLDKLVNYNFTIETAIEIMKLIDEKVEQK